MLKLSFERPRARNLPGKASPTRLDKRAERLDVDLVLPYQAMSINGRIQLVGVLTVEVLVALPRLSKTYGGGNGGSSSSGSESWEIAGTTSIFGTGGASLGRVRGDGMLSPR